MATKLVPIDYEKLAGNCKALGEVDHVERLQRVAHLLADAALLDKLTLREQDYAMVLIKAGNVVNDYHGVPHFAVDDAPAAKVAPKVPITAPLKAK